MTIETEIHQARWESFRQKAVINILYTCRVLEESNEALLKPFDLTLPQFNILRILRGQKGKPATVKLLTERMLDKSSNASRLVDKLLEKGLVNRISCPNDRRAVEVTITQAGLDLLKIVDKEVRSFSAAHPDFTEADARQLSDLLDRLRITVRPDAQS
jgi:DNA-binding MarR family transcriptional regulator